VVERVVQWREEGEREHVVEREAQCGASVSFSILFFF
jgi:hypothetical protein